MGKHLSDWWEMSIEGNRYLWPLVSNKSVMVTLSLEKSVNLSLSPVTAIGWQLAWRYVKPGLKCWGRVSRRLCHCQFFSQFLLDGHAGFPEKLLTGSFCLLLKLYHWFRPILRVSFRHGDISQYDQTEQCHIFDWYHVQDIVFVFITQLLLTPLKKRSEATCLISSWHNWATFQNINDSMCSYWMIQLNNLFL